MNDQEALAIFLNDGVTKAKLAKRYAEIAGTIASAPLSMKLKNTLVDGEAEKGGTVKVYRLNTAVDQDYGTARAAGEGNKLKDSGVDVKIDTDKEIVEEVEYKDLKRFGLDGILARRTANHPVAMGIRLDTEYFRVLQTAATVISLTGSTTVEKILSLIQHLELLENDNVNGVDRELMVLTLAPKFYDTLVQYTNTLPNPAGQNVRYLHGVEVHSAPRQEFDAIIQVRGAVAQPVGVTPYSASRIPLSNAFAIELYYSFGTKAIMPDTIFAGALDGTISV